MWSLQKKPTNKTALFSATAIIVRPPCCFVWILESLIKAGIVWFGSNHKLVFQEQDECGPQLPVHSAKINHRSYLAAAALNEITQKDVLCFMTRINQGLK